MRLTRHFESKGFVSSPVERVFAHLDDHTRLSSHMSKSSWMMGGGKMTLEMDEAEGKRLGSRIRLAGHAFGIDLYVDEIVTEYFPPHRKVWQTVDSPKLLIMEQYRMGFELTPRENGSALTVFIDYSLPSGIFTRYLGKLFGRHYARWCTQRMLADAQRFFSPSDEQLQA